VLTLIRTASGRSKTGTRKRGLTSWTRVLLQKQTGFQLVKKIAVLCRTRKFISLLTRSRHLSFTELDRSSQWPTSHFLMNHFNINFSTTPVASMWSLSFRRNTLNLVDNSLQPICYFSIRTSEKYCVGSSNQQTPHFVVVSTRLLTRPSEVQLLYWARWTQNPQPTFFSQRDRTCFTPIQHNMQNYNSLYLNFVKESRRQIILHRIKTSIPWFPTPLNFFLNTKLLCCSHLLEIFHNFKGAIICLYIFTSFCILMYYMTIYSVLIAFTSTTNSLPADNITSVFYLILCTISPIKLSTSA
jgi:hypothetical protein